jgi:parallel beta-helix repeat protein
MRKLSAITTILLLIFGSLVGFIALEPEPVSALTTHDPIFINGNSNFTSANGVTGGNGTPSDPYIIDGWNITSSSATQIKIRNTTAHFVIRNVSLDPGPNTVEGIYLDNCTNGQIINATISNATRGIFLYQTSYINISRCNISNSYYGIFLVFDSDNNIITDNEIIDNDWGILVSYSSYNYFKNNSIKYNSNSGLEISWSPFNNITENYFFKNQNGVKLDYSSYINVSKNEIISNNEYGVGTRGSRWINISNNNISVNKDGINFNNVDWGKVIENQISYNKRQGIYFSSSRINIILGNIIKNNTDYGILLDTSSNINKVINNEILGHKYYGIKLNSGTNNNFSYNTISDTTGIGVYFDYSDNNCLTNNNLRNHVNGLSIRQSSSNKIAYNNISHNTYYGIKLSYSDSNELTSNNISSNGDEGILIYNSYHVTIKDNNISFNDFGVYLGNGAYQTILFNNTFIANNNTAIYCSSAVANKIFGNRMMSNIYDINISMSSYNKFYENDMDGSGISFYGSDKIYWITNEIDTTNTLNGKPIHFWKNRTLEELSAGNAGQIIIVNCTNATISNIDVSHSYSGMTLSYSSGNLIHNNTISSNDGYGIYLYKANENHINNNFITLNEFGILIDKSKDNLIYNNKVSKSIRDGINFKPFSYNNLIKNNSINESYGNGIAFDDYNADNNVIIKNVINSNNENGIYFYRADSNSVIDNIINLNYENGMLISRSNYNTIFNNTFSSNKKNGLKFVYNSWRNDIFTNDFYGNQKAGISIEDSDDNEIYHNTMISNMEYGLYLVSTRDCIIYHNNFVTNNIQAFDDDNWNQWYVDYPIGGNYWSDFAGTDNFKGPNQNKPGKDGICDETYLVNFQNKDDYPLMIPSDLKPSVPQNLQAESNDHYINLTWDPPAFTGSFPLILYRLYRDHESGFNPIAEVEDLSEFNDTKITTGFTYFYRVSAVNAMGESPLTEPLEVKARTIVVPKVPTEPINLKGEPKGDHILLTWNYPLDDGQKFVTNYRLYKGLTEGGEIYFKNLATTHEYKDTEVGPGMTYYYKISAVNEIGEGPFSDAITVTIPTFPDAPRDLTAETGDSFVNLTWKEPSSDGGLPVEFYIIYRGTNLDDLKLHLEYGNQTFYQDIHVENGVVYYYRVSAENALGEGLLSEEVVAIPGIKTNLAPVASIKTNITAGPPPLTVAFTGLGLDSDGVIIKYLWDFDDGNTSTEQTPTHTFRKIGTYFVKLTVTDDDGELAVAMVTINVAPNTVPDPDDKPDKSTEPDEERSPWAYAAGATFGVGIMIIFLLILAFPAAFNRRTKEDAEKHVLKKEITVTRVPLKQTQTIDKDQLDDEELME